MRLYSYVVARDFGFAPNPFYGFCTLATCKPNIRQTAQVGDWVIGTGSKSKGRDGHLVFAMRVTEALTFDEYWADPRFAPKRPSLHGSLKQAFGDNIYHHGVGGWSQENSHHSMRDGTANPVNVDHDTRTDRVLISDHFAYWGGAGPEIPADFRDWDGIDLSLGRQGHRCNFPDELAAQVVSWLEQMGMNGYEGRPG
ncbi:MAG: hypothetical protein ACRDG7_19230, partial [Candidatus Limnocylindria bacterium]